MRTRQEIVNQQSLLLLNKNISAGEVMGIQISFAVEILLDIRDLLEKDKRGSAGSVGITVDELPSYRGY